MSYKLTYFINFAKLYDVNRIGYPQNRILDKDRKPWVIFTEQ